MKYLESDNQVIAYSMYDQGSPDPWNIIHFLNKFQDKKIIFVDLLEFHPYYALRTNKDLHRYYVNNIIARNRLKVEYWISLHSNHRHEEFYNYNITVKNWPSFLLYFTHNMLDGGGKKYKSHPPFTDVNKLAICLNGKPRQHRCILIDKIHRRQLQDHMHISWLVPDDGGYTFKWFNNKQIVLDYDPGPSPDSSTICVKDAIIPDQTQEALFALVAETSIKYQDISEKTFMYIEAKQPFVVFGAPGIHRILRRYYGFKLYTDHIDYGFDYIKDPNIRADKILNELQKHRGADYAQLKEEMFETAEYNYQLYMDIISSARLIPEHIKKVPVFQSLVKHPKPCSRICG